MIRRFTTRPENQKHTDFPNTSSPQNYNPIECIKKFSQIFSIFGLIFLFSFQSAQAQCDISYTNDGEILLSLDEFGSAAINATLFEPYVSSSNSFCLPEGGGSINLYMDAGKMMVFSPSFYDCTHIGDVYDVYVAIMDGNANESAAILFEIEIVDLYAPDLECPSNVVTTLNSGFCTKTISDIEPVVAYDNCAGFTVDYTITGTTTATGIVDASGTSFSPGVSTVEYYAEDNEENFAECEFTVTVSFPQPYSISNCSNDITVNTDLGTCNKVVTYPTPNAINGCAVTFTAATTNPTSGDTLSVGEYPVSFSFDNGTDVATCAFNISVRDDEAPVMTTANQTITTSGCQANYSDDLSTDISDNCTAFLDLDISYTITGTGVFINETGTDIDETLAVGDYDIEFTIEDATGNDTLYSYTLSVLDNIPPTAMTQDISVYLDLNGDISVDAEDVDDGSFDNCSTLFIYEIAKDDNGDGMPDDLFGSSAGDWVSSLDYTCSDIGTNNVLFRVFDSVNGNVSSVKTAIITIVDNLLPVAHCEDIEVTIPSGTTVLINAQDLDQGSNDNCNIITNYEISVDTLGDGTYGYAYAADYMAKCPIPASGYFDAKMRVTDGSGAMTECLAKITILDDTAPVAVAMNFTADLDINGEIRVYADSLDNGSMEDCGGMTFTYSHGAAGPFAASMDYDCDDIGTYNNVYLEVTNSAGLSSITGPVTLVVQDDIDPTLVAVAGITVTYDASGDITILAEELDNGSTDNCDDLTYGISTSATGTFTSELNLNCTTVPFPTDVYLEVTDGSSNNIVSAAIPVTVDDILPPTAVCITSISVALISTSVVVNEVIIDAGSYDACGGTIASIDVAWDENGNGIFDAAEYGDNLIFSCDEVGTNMVSLVATDATGLQSTCNAVVVVQETQPPVFTALPPAVVDVQCSDYITDADYDFDDAAEAMDNCDIQGITFEDSGSLNSCMVGNITRTYTATDVAGNTTTAQITINVQDTIAPIFIAPADYIGECSSVGSGYSIAAAGEPTDEEDNCDPLAVNGGLRDAYSSTYHAFIGFTNHSGIVPTSYNFSTGNWTSTGGTLVNTTNAPESISMTSRDNGSILPVNFTISALVDGWYSFDYSYSTADGVASDDPFGTLVNGTFEAVEGTSGRVFIELSAGDVFGFSQTSIDGVGGSATTVISNFVFVDEDTAPQELGCPSNRDVARIWGMTDCQGNNADDQLQIIQVRDTQPPAFDFEDNFTVSTPINVCSPWIDLDMMAGARFTEGCDLDYITNDASTIYGIGDGAYDASGYYNPGTYTITFRAKDMCHPEVVFPVTFTVVDDVNPQVICQDIVLTIDNSGVGTIIPSDVVVSTHDNCGINASLSVVTPNTFTNDDFGLNTVTVTITDMGGNTNTCNSTVDVSSGIEYNVDMVSGAAGSIVNLPITTRYYTDINSFSMTLNIVDIDVATIVGISGLNSDLAGIFDYNIVNDGQIDLSYFDAGSGTLPILDDVILFNLEIQFDPLATAGEITEVNITNAASYRDDASGTPQSVPTLSNAGSAEVAAAGSLINIAGNVKTVMTNENVENATINLSGTTINSMLTATDGNFDFDVPSGSTQTVAPYKNTNWTNGGNVNILDVLAVHRLSLGIDNYSNDWQKIAADANGMDSLNIIDVLLTHRVSLGIINNIPSNTSWRFTPSNEAIPSAPFYNGFNEDRLYSNVTTAVTDADFLGIKICDIVAPFASGSGFVSWDTEERDSEDLVFTVNDFALVAGQQYSVEITAKDFNGISAYQYSLEFDETVLQLDNIIPSAIPNLSADNFNSTRSNEGLVGTDWYDLHPQSIEDETVMFTLNFTALEGGLNLQDVLTAQSEIMEAFYSNSSQEIGDVVLEFTTTTAVAPSPNYEFELLQNQPNPFSDYSVISFVMPQNEVVNLTITDLSGKVVYIAPIEALKGHNQVRIDRNNLPASGVYSYHVATETGTAVRKMVVLK